MSWFDDNAAPGSNPNFATNGSGGPLSPGSPTSQVMPNAPAGGAPSGGSMPQLTPGMSDDQVRAAVNQYITAAGLPNTDNGQYWVDLYKQNPTDPGYVQTKMLNGIQQNGGNMQPFSALLGPNIPGGYGPGTSGAAGGAPGSTGGYTPGVGANPYGTMAGSPNAFVQPSAADMMANDPGYQARLATGEQAVQGAAAAKGSVLSGGTLKALNDYSQQFASNEYGNYFNQALQGYQTNTGTQRNAMNDYYSRLQGLYGTGQNATTGTAAATPTS